MARDRYDDDDDDLPRSRRRSRADDDDDYVPPHRRRPARRDEEDDDDEPQRAKGTNGLATASLVFGVLSFCTGITFIPGLICGFMGLSKSKKTGTGKGVAIAGLLTSAGGLFVSALLGLGGYFLYEKADEARARSRTQNNFKQAGLGTFNYESSYGTYPKPFCDETPGFRPPPSESELPSKLSWRVSLLPYVEQGPLYNRFNRSDMWDSSTNKPLSQTVVSQYADADTPLDPATRIRCFYGPGTMFELDGRVSITSVTDGTSNTLLYVEGAEKVTWSQFNEYKFSPNGPLPALGHPKRDTFVVEMVDGSVRSVRKTISPTTLRALITRNGGEVTGYDW